MRYPLPNDTAELLPNDSATPIGNNPGLALDKFRRVGESWKITDDSKKRKDIPQPASIVVNNAAKRHKEMLKSLTAQPKPYFEAKVDYRLVVGFGAEHVLETNLYLHRIYGFPIIPGSAVKGVTRAFAFWQIAQKLGLIAADYFELMRRDAVEPKIKTPLTLLGELLGSGETQSLSNDELKQLKEIQKSIIDRLKEDELCTDLPEVQQLDFAKWQTLAAPFYQVFGTTKKQGQVTFFDAYPTQAPKLEPDILNPHFGDYYGSPNDAKKPPADYGNPKPTFFLTVARGSNFLFAVASRNDELTKKANEWLKGGLLVLGIGGKTAAGYGFMKPLS